MNELSAAEVRERLRLRAHPEGGHYREVFRSGTTVQPRTGAVRVASTSILYLLEAGDFSAFHRIHSDEIWHFYAGGPMELHLIKRDGSHATHVLGPELAREHAPQHAVPSLTWQAARPAPGAKWSLVGCTVAPGFEFADFELAQREDLLAAFPAHQALIRDLTR